MQDVVLSKKWMLRLNWTGWPRHYRSAGGRRCQTAQQRWAVRRNPCLTIARAGSGQGLDRRRRNRRCGWQCMQLRGSRRAVPDQQPWVNTAVDDRHGRGRGAGWHDLPRLWSCRRQPRCCCARYRGRLPGKDLIHAEENVKFDCVRVSVRSRSS